MEFDFELSEFRPVIDRRSKQVIAWRVRVTLTKADNSIFDFLRFGVGHNLKPLEAWTFTEVAVEVRKQIIGTRHAPFNELVDKFRGRLHFYVNEDFCFPEEVSA